MNTVFMCGSEIGFETINMLFTAIMSVHSSALHVGTETISLIPLKAKNPDFIVIDNPSIVNVHTPGGIVLFRKHAPIKQHIDIPSAYFAVVDSENRNAAGMLCNDGIQTVTCGLSQKDTITFSSLDSDRAVVSLQRGLKALDGTNIGPVDVPITFEPSHSEYPLLAAVAVLLLSCVKMPDEGLELK